MNGSRFVTVTQAAAHFGVSPKTIYRRVKDRSLPSRQIGGRGAKILIPLEALECAVVVAHDDVAPASDDQAIKEPTARGLPGPKPRWLQR